MFSSIISTKDEYFAFMNSGTGDADYSDYIHEMNGGITALLSIFITNSRQTL